MSASALAVAVLTTISVWGGADADYDTVAFSVTIDGRGETGPTAKAALKQPIADLEAVLQELKSGGVVFDEATRTSSLSVRPERVYDKDMGASKIQGHLARYQLILESPNVEFASEIHDGLTSLKGAQVESPQFRVKDVATLQHAAFKDAVAKAKARFAEECAALGLSPKMYKVHSWTSDRDDSRRAGHGALRSLADDSMNERDEPIAINSGKARITVRLSVAFAALP